jgi:hypothetical protein
MTASEFFYLLTHFRQLVLFLKKRLQPFIYCDKSNKGFALSMRKYAVGRRPEGVFMSFGVGLRMDWGT